MWQIIQALWFFVLIYLIKKWWLVPFTALKLNSATADTRIQPGIYQFFIVLSQKSFLVKWLLQNHFSSVAGDFLTTQDGKRKTATDFPADL